MQDYKNKNKNRIFHAIRDFSGKILNQATGLKQKLIHIPRESLDQMDKRWSMCAR